MFNGKMKAVTFSFDDGVTQDIRLAALFNKYGLKATFNLNSALLGAENRLHWDDKSVAHNKVTPAQVPEIYAGHEIAAHTLTHPRLTDVEDKKEIFRQVETDRQLLSALAGYEVVGFAYPGGGVNCSPAVADIVRTTGAKYARTIQHSNNFDLQSDLYVFKPTVHAIHFDELDRLTEEFIALEPDSPKLFYVWGHSYEFDIDDTWARFEAFCKKIAGRGDICYCTNKEALL